MGSTKQENSPDEDQDDVEEEDPQQDEQPANQDNEDPAPEEEQGTSQAQDDQSPNQGGKNKLDPVPEEEEEETTSQVPDQENPEPGDEEQKTSGAQDQPGEFEQEQEVPRVGSHDLVDSFRPHRVNSTSVEEPQHSAEEDPATMKGVPQTHKPHASAYTLLQERDNVSLDNEGHITRFRNIDDQDNDMDDIDENASKADFSTSVVDTAPAPVRRPRWRKFKKYVYNNESNTYCNRTLTNWCAICTFYFWIIILFLAIFMIYILSFVWRDRESSTPAFLKVEIMPDPNPALAPVPLDPKKGMIMWYNSHGSGNERKPKDSVKDISKFLAKQELTCHQQKLLHKVCRFNRAEFGPCADPSYGYDDNKPCIFLKLNKLITWMPTPFHRHHRFEDDISSDLVNKIRNETPRHCVYVDCRGKTLYDQQYLGNIKYYPEPAYDPKHFPATKDTKTNPVVAIKLDEIEIGHVLQIHCTLLAGNIKDKANSNIKLIVYIK